MLGRSQHFFIREICATTRAGCWSKMSGEICVVTKGSVDLIVTNNLNEFSAEKRFQKNVTVGELKGRLELVTGISPATMRLELYDKSNILISYLHDDEALLGSYPGADDGNRLHVIGKGTRLGEYDDLSKVEKMKLTEEEYSKRNDTVKAYLMRNKIGKYADTPDGENQLKQKEKEEEVLAKATTVGSRCEVALPGQPAKRGTVKFVGKTDFKPGWWVGVQYDEPMGKNDGSVDGKRYFSCPPKYGAFIKPQHVTIGDFPEEDLDFEDEM